MPRLKGMDTWMWLIGGIIITLLCFVIFMEIFSSITAQNHTQVSFETQANLASDVNRLCSMLEGQSQKQTLKFSTIATDFFASDNTTLIGKDVRTYGKRLCLNVSGKVSCEDLDCPLELDPIIKEKKILNLLDKLKGELNYREYEVELVRTKCGVSIVNLGSEPGCACGLEDFEVPAYCNYNGRQPFIISKGKVVILSDAEFWTSPNTSSEKIFSNIANYLGGGSILVVFEENLTDPDANGARAILNSLESRGFSVTVKKHSAEIDLSGYNQVWLVTPGFCGAQERNCSDYKKWGINEQKNLINFAKSGNGLLLITDSAMAKGIYERVDLSFINKIFAELGFPIEQILSCVCGCEYKPYNETVFENHTLTQGLSNVSLVGAAVFRETCVYTTEKPNTTGSATCSPDGKCYLGCPAGDPDCSCLEEGGFICNDIKYCLGILLKNAGSKVCCSSPCSLTNPNECQNTSDVPEGGACVCTGQCQPSLTCGSKKHCCPSGAEWNGSNCTKAAICSSPAPPCNGNFHWTHFGSGRFHENVGENSPCGGGYPGTRCPSCDYFEVCQSPVVKPVAEEIVNCCNSQCKDSGGHGSCHQYCSSAVSNSGLSSTVNENTQKKCYGLYVIYGMGPAARWTRGYQVRIEEPASVMLSGGTWMCTGYSTILTTLLRSVGYATSEAYTVLSDDHAYNIVKFPGDSKYTIADTVGNRPHPVGLGSLPGGYQHCSYWSNTCSNDAGMGSCPSKGNVFGC